MSCSQLVSGNPLKYHLPLPLQLNLSKSKGCTFVFEDGPMTFAKAQIMEALSRTALA